MTETNYELLEHRVEVLEKWRAENSKLETRVMELVGKMDLYSEKVTNLTERIEARISLMEDRQMRQGERIGALETKPAKHFEHLIKTAVGALITAGVGLLIGYLISRGGA